MSCYDLSVALHSHPGRVVIIRRSLAGVHYGSQDTNGAVYRPNLHSAHMAIFEVIVRLETLPLHQLLLRVHPRTLHKIAKEVRVLNGWPKTHVVLEFAIVPRRGGDLELEGGVNACHVEYVYKSRDFSTCKVPSNGVIEISLLPVCTDDTSI